MKRIRSTRSIGARWLRFEAATRLEKVWIARPWRRVSLAVTLLVVADSGSYAQSALPQGGQVATGSAVIGVAGNGVTINQTSSRAVIDWTSFNVGQNKTVVFDQPGSTSATLNRVAGTTSSTIAGDITSNGQVFLLNPNGIVITSTGTVTSGGGFVASTLQISDADFIGGSLAFAGQGRAVSNQGSIRSGGFAALLGSSVANTGTITVPGGKIGLGAGSAATLDLYGDGFLQVTLPGKGQGTLIDAGGFMTGARIELRAAVAQQAARATVNVPGILTAQSARQEGGTIILDAGTGAVAISGELIADSATGRGGAIAIGGTTIALSGGRIDASGSTQGGDVSIGVGRADVIPVSPVERITIDAATSIDVSATGFGDGGRVSVLADTGNPASTLAFDGSIAARGGSRGGNGGNVETSAAHVTIGDEAKVTTLAPRGEVGGWLLDPVDFTIAAAGGDMTGTALSSALSGGNVTIASSSGSSGVNGDVNVNDTVTWSAHTLTLNAYRDINFNSTLTVSGTGKLALLDSQSTAAGTAGNGYFLAPGVAINLPAGANFSTKFGSTGTVANYMVITALGSAGSLTGTDLQGINGALTGNYVLGANINAAATSGWNAALGFAPLGTSAVPFSGQFDGLGHSISGLTIARPSTNYIGLFGEISASASVRSVGLLNVAVTGASDVGGVIGYDASSATQAFTGSDGNGDYVTGTVTGTTLVGGLVGYQSAGIISINNNLNAAGTAARVVETTGGSGSYVGGLVGESISGGTLNITSSSAGQVTGAGAADVGGLVGGINAGTITGSNYTLPLASTGNNVGGLIGVVNGAATVVGSYDTSTIGGGNSVGGLIGYAGGTATLAFTGSDGTGSYFTGTVTGTNFVGGLVGTQSAGIININNNLNAAGTAGKVVETTGGNGSYIGGLVGQSISGGTLNITNSSAGQVTGSNANDVGGLVGGINTGTITGSNYTLPLASSGANLGGLVGVLGGTATVVGSYDNSTVSGYNYVGGVLGYDSSSATQAFSGSGGTGNYFTGTVTGTNFVGGLVGAQNAGTININNNLNAVGTAGKVVETTGGNGSYVGGLVGQNNSGGTLNITNSSAGQVTGSNASDVGGLIGGINTGTITGSSYTLPLASTGGNVGGLVGVLSGTAAVVSSYDNSTVSGGNSVGGVIGNDASSATQSFTGSDGTGDYFTGTVTGTNFVGGLVGSQSTGTINVNNNQNAAGTAGKVIETSGGSGSYLGGLVGQNSSSGALNITNSSAGQVSGANTSYVGGLVGGITTGTITDSDYTLALSTTGTNVGGIAGQLKGGSSITSSFATGNVMGASNVGGLVGSLAGTAIVTGAYASGAVSGTSSVGGVIGNDASTATQVFTGSDGTGNYFTGTVTGTNFVGGLVGAQSAGTININNNLNAAGTAGKVVETSGGNGSYVGGLVGQNTSGGTLNITGSSAGQVTGANASYVGGLVGGINTGTITGSNYTLPLASTGGNVGGLVGVLNGAATIASSDDNSTVSGTGSVGGLIGYDGSTATQAFTGSDGSGNYFTGTVTGTNFVGGLVGTQSAGTISINNNLNAAGTAGKVVETAGGNGSYLGGLVGQNISGTLTVANSGAGQVTGGNASNVGGLVGSIASGSIANSDSLNNVSGASNVGGVAGQLAGTASITGSFATSSVSGTSNVGGLVGSVASGAAVSNAYASGAVSGSSNVGGLVGLNQGTLTNTYANGLVTGSTDAGALIGNNTATTLVSAGPPAVYTTTNGTISNSFWDSSVNASTLGVGSGAVSGATGMSTANMETQSNFTSATAANGNVNPNWNYGSVWFQYSGHNEPLLRYFMTPLTITANNDTKTYDALAYNGAAGVRYSATPNLAEILGTPNYSGGVNAGSYVINVTGLYSNQLGYLISLASGTLTVNPRALTLTYNAAGSSSIYGATPSGLSGTVTGNNLVGSDTVAGVSSGMASWTTSASGTSSVGSYAISGSGLSANSANYTISFAQAPGNASALTVSPATLIVTADNATKTYDALGYSGGNGAVYSGFVNGDSSSSLGGTLTYSGSSQGAVNAGSYTLTAGGQTASNYTLDYVPGTLTVNPRALTLTYTATGATSIYGTTPSGLNGTVTGNNLVGSDTVAGVSTGTALWTTPASGTSSVGSYAISGSGLSANSANYTISFAQAPGNASALTVSPATLMVTADSATKTYDSSSYSGGNGVSYAGFVNGDSAGSLGGTLSYGGTSQGAVNAGSYILTAGGQTASNYTLDYVPGTLTVNPRALTLTYTATGSSSIYGTTPSGLSGTVTGNNLVGGDTVAEVSSGTALWTSPASGASPVGGYAINGSGLIANSSNYTISFAQAVSNASAFTVIPATLTVTADNATKTYDSLGYSGGNGVSYAGFVNGDSAGSLGGTLSYGGTSQGAVNAGSYSLTAGGQTASNYTLDYVPGILTVSPRALTLTYAATSAGSIYGTIPSGLSGTVTGNNLVGSDTVAGVSSGTALWTTPASGASSVGSYAINGGGLSANSSNYTISFAQAPGNANALTVSPATLMVTANNATKTYDALGYSGGNGVSYTGFVNGDSAASLGGSLSYGGTSQGAVNAGNYTLTAGGQTASNYTIDYVSGVLAVNPRALTLTYTASGATSIYGTPPSGLTGTVTGNNLVGSDTVAEVSSGTVSWTTPATAAASVGSYAINGSGLSPNSSNYTISFAQAASNAAALTVSPATLMVIADDATKTYDALGYSGGNGVVYSGFVNGDSASSLGGTLSYGGTSQGAVNAGNYTLTAGGQTASNYTLDYLPGMLTVNPRPLTLTYTATGASSIYGTTPSGLNGAVTGNNLVGSDTVVGVSSGTASWITPASAASSVGSYAINGSGLSANSSNYTISFAQAPGNASALTVSPAILMVTADNATKTYDSLGYSGGNGVSYAGFVNGDTASSLGGTLTYGGTSQGAVNAGSYSLTAGGQTASNYFIDYLPGTLTVNPRALTLTYNATGSSSIYGATPSGLSGTVTANNLVGSDTVADVSSGMASWTTPASGTSSVGSYAINGNGLIANSSNYTISFAQAPGNASALTVSPATLMVMADNATKTYDSLSYSGGNGVVYAGFVNGDSAVSLGGTLSFGGTSQGAVNAGSYTLTAGGQTASNYTLDYVPGTLTVNPRALTLTYSATGSSSIYGTTPSGLSGTVTANNLVGSDTVAGVSSGTASWTTPASGTSSVGSYAIYGSGLSANSSNYTISFAQAPGNASAFAVSPAMTINPAPPTVTAPAVTYPSQVLEPSPGAVQDLVVDRSCLLESFTDTKRTGQACK